MPATRTLNDIMSFDHVIQVHEDGTITEPPDIWAPELNICEDEDGQYVGEPLLSGCWRNGVQDRWVLLNGYSGQDRYSGPLMHSSEFIGGGMENDIRSEPGVYVALACYSLVPDGCEDDGPHTWAVARLED